MTYNKTTFDCTCNACSHEWRARTPHLPKKCPKCTSVKWNDSGNKKYSVIVSRACGKEENSERSVFCILEMVDNPETITDDIFYVKEEDFSSYLKGNNVPPGSAVVFIGDMEIDAERELIINEMTLIYIHQKAFRGYTSDVKCGYNINSYYEKQKQNKRYAELEEDRQRIANEKRKANLEDQKKKLEEEQEKLNMKRQILAEIEGV